MNMEDISETGPTVYSSYPRRLESLTISNEITKGSTFVFGYSKIQSFDPARVRTRDLPRGSPMLNQS